MATEKTPLTVVKLKPATHARLQAIAREQQRPMGDVVTDLVEQYQRDRFWQSVNEAIERLRADPVAWRDYQDEIACFAGGSLDGLEEEEPYFSTDEEALIRSTVTDDRALGH